MKRNQVLLELIQVSIDKVHQTKHFRAVNGNVSPEFAAISSIYIYMALENYVFNQLFLSRRYINITAA